MRRWLSSLNLRFGLILLLALAASYSLMTWFLHTRLDEVRVGQMAASVAVQVRQAEGEVKAASPTAGLGARIHEGGFEPRGRPLPDGMGAFPGGPEPRREEAPLRRDGPFPEFAHEVPPRPEFRDLHLRLAQALEAELKRPVALHFGHGPRFGPGVWVRLSGEPERWLWTALPVPAPERWSDGVLVVPIVGFVLAFVAGLFLVIQVNRPLRRLGDALAQVGGRGEPQPLSPEGSSEIRALSGHFNAMLDRLKRMEVDRATMLAGIAHDLRTPITRLQLQIELAGGPRKDAMLRELAQMSEIFEQFRLFAGGGQGERAEQRDLGLLLEELVDPWRDNGLGLDLASELRAEVKPAALRRAVGNLLDNAFAYGAVPVALRLYAHGREAVIEISDHGKGIPEERIAEALRPFSRLDPARGGNGHSGLGLAIVDRLVADMGGRLELENRPGGGLIARLVLLRSEL